MPCLVRAAGIEPGGTSTVERELLQHVCEFHIFLRAAAVAPAASQRAEGRHGIPGVIPEHIIKALYVFQADF